jgi:hypothetical protein
MHRLALCFIVMSFGSAAIAQVNLQVKFHELPEEFDAIKPLIKENVLAAAQAWVEHIRTKRCTIDIIFRLDPATPRVTGRSLVSAPASVPAHHGKKVLEQGWVSEMRTGVDPNRADPDVEVVFNPEYLRTIWWDPEPLLRREAVSKGKLDGQSVVMHEFGHALAFNGWLDPQTGELRGQVLSTYDRHVSYDGENFSFNGPAAVKELSRRIPLARTLNNYHHFGDKAYDNEKNGTLPKDLMNGLYFEYELRYEVSALDLAILRDCGIPLRSLKDARPATKQSGEKRIPATRSEREGSTR